jgi:hypothetical protein
MDQDPGDQRRASLRASDADRERFVEALSQHHADGRLTTAPGGPAKTNLLRSVLWYGVLSLVLIVVWSRVSPYDDDRFRRRDDNP